MAAQMSRSRSDQHESKLNLFVRHRAERSVRGDSVAPGCGGRIVMMSLIRGWRNLIYDRITNGLAKSNVTALNNKSHIYNV